MAVNEQGSHQPDVQERLKVHQDIMYAFATGTPISLQVRGMRGQGKSVDEGLLQGNTEDHTVEDNIWETKTSLKERLLDELELDHKLDLGLPIEDQRYSIKGLSKRLGRPPRDLAVLNNEIIQANQILGQRFRKDSRVRDVRDWARYRTLRRQGGLVVVFHPRLPTQDPKPFAGTQ